MAAIFQALQPAVTANQVQAESKSRKRRKKKRRGGRRSRNSRT
ncbi:MAG: hypothetical protein QM692_21710 [Thermomicrobiales bacterium]